MSTLSTCVIVNPASANGSTERDWPAIQNLLEFYALPYEARVTTAPGQAMALTRRALQDGFNCLIAVGGDGTINEVVNGWIGDDRPVNPEAVLGIIPRGTGCDFIRTLGIPRDTAQAIACIAAGNERRIDLGRVRFINHAGVEEVRYYDNIADIGIGGAVVDRVNRTTKVLGGFASFLIATVATFWSYRNKPTRVVIGEGPERELVTSNVVVANCQYFGGGMCILPQAVPDDGWLDVLIMKDFSRAEAYANVLRVYNGSHLQHPKIEVFRAKRVTVTSPEPLLLDIDGEYAGRAPAEFTIVPQALRVLVP